MHIQSHLLIKSNVKNLDVVKDILLLLMPNAKNVTIMKLRMIQKEIVMRQLVMMDKLF